MIETEAIHIAKTTAERLNLPSDGTASVKRLIRVWPLPGHWQITIQSEQPKAQVTLVVDETSGECFPKCVVYNSK